LHGNKLNGDGLNEWHWQQVVAVGIVIGSCGLFVNKIFFTPLHFLSILRDLQNTISLSSNDYKIALLRSERL